MNEIHETADGVLFELGMTVYKVEGDMESCDIYVKSVNTDTEKQRFTAAIKGGKVWMVGRPPYDKQRWTEWFIINQVYANEKNAIREKIVWMQDHVDDILEEIEKLEKGLSDNV